MSTKRILVPTDFSIEADSALQTACLIGRTMNRPVTLLHVMEPVKRETAHYRINSEEGLRHYSEVLEQHVLDRMHKVANHPKFEDLSMECLVLRRQDRQTVAQCISDHANELDYHLIVMGTTGAEGLKSQLEGTRTTHVARLADCPVISVSSYDTEAQMSNVVYASDFQHQDINHEAFEQVLELSNVFGATVHLLQVDTHDFSDSEMDFIIEKSMKHFADQWSLDNYTLNIENTNSVEQGILRFATGTHADLIIMNTRQHKGIRKLFEGSLAESLIQHSPIPVCTFRKAG